MEGTIKSTMIPLDQERIHKNTFILFENNNKKYFILIFYQITSINATVGKDGSGEQEHHDFTEPRSWYENQCFIFALWQTTPMNSMLAKDGNSDHNSTKPRKNIQKMHLFLQKKKLLYFYFLSNHAYAWMEP